MKYRLFNFGLYETSWLRNTEVKVVRQWFILTYKFVTLIKLSQRVLESRYISVKRRIGSRILIMILENLDPVAWDTFQHVLFLPRLWVGRQKNYISIMRSSYSNLEMFSIYRFWSYAIGFSVLLKANGNSITLLCYVL